MDATHRRGAIPHYAEGGLIKSIRSLMPSVAASPKPKDAPLGTGAADQARTALTTRKQVLDDAEKKAVGMARGGALRHDMAGGGKIPGKSPTPTADNIRVDATAGEFMLRKPAADVLGPKVLNALNALGGKNPVPAKGKGHGAIRKMAQGGIVKPLTEEERRRAISQIPTGGAPGAGPTPGNGNSVDSTELGRNVSNTINALGGVVPGLTAARGLMGASRVGTAAEAIGRGATSLATSAGPYTAPIAGFGALQAASSPPQTLQSSATSPTVAPTTQALPASTSPDQGEPGAAGRPAGAIRQLANNTVNVERQANGNLSFSGQNVSGPIQYAGAEKAGFKPGGGTFSSLDTSQGYAQNLKELARIEAEKEKLRIGLREQDIYNQAQAGNTTAVRALTRQAKRETQGKQDAQQAAERGATQKLAQDKFDLEKDGAKLDQQSRAQLAGLQNIALDPNATPEQRKSALATYRALTGKSETQNRYTVFSLPDQVIDGQVVRGGQAVIDNTTGQRVQQQGEAPAAQNFEVGKTYVDGAGRKAKWDGQKFVPL